MTYCYLPLCNIFPKFENTCVFKDENNTKPLVVFSEHVLVISKAFCTLIFASEKSIYFSACQVDEYALNISLMPTILFSYAIRAIYFR